LKCRIDLAEGKNCHRRQEEGKENAEKEEVLRNAPAPNVKLLPTSVSQADRKLREMENGRKAWG